MADTPFTIYKASAGAGKTYTLVKEYLKMIFDCGEDHLFGGLRSVLAITFTNKAVAEMKERIMKELRGMATVIADPEGRGMASDILRELSLEPAALHRMAAKLYSLVLHRYSHLSVSTIDSFTNRVVRTFAHDLGQPVNYEVTVEPDDLKAQAVAGLMSLVGTEGYKPLADMLTDYAESNMDDGKSYDVERSLTELADQLFKEDIESHVARLENLDLSDFIALHRSYVAKRKAAESMLVKLGKDAMQLIADAGFEQSDCNQGTKGFYGYFEKLSQGLRPKVNAYVSAAMDEGKLLKAKPRTGLQAVADSLWPQLQAICKRVKQQEVEINTCTALLKNLYPTALLHLLDEQMHAYMDGNEQVVLSDFNRMVNSVVEDNPAPFIYERIGNRYRHLLIDEFQDTSVMQWHNLVPLVENGVSQHQGSLVVGDGKQSIYRFRQGDVEQFVSLPRVEGMRHHGQTLSMPGNYSVKSLEHNRRSGTAIIDFNNSFFSHLARTVYAGNPLVQDVYVGRLGDGGYRPEGKEELRQKHANPMDGYVEVALVGKDDEEANVPDAICDRVLQTILRLTGGQGYAYSDILILGRNNRDVHRVSDYLAQHSDVPQTSSESFYLSSSHAVMAIVSTLRLVHNRADRVAAADLLYRMQALGLAAPETDCRDAQLGRLPGLNFDYLAALGIYDCCEEIVRQLSLDGIDTPYVASILGGAASLAARHKQSVADFLEWFDSKAERSASTSDSLDAVQLLTVHKAKGLGKPVVIFPYFGQKKHPARIWVDVEAGGGEEPTVPTAFVELGEDTPTRFEAQRRQEAAKTEVDELNVLYVAFTRPQEQLYVFCESPSEKKKDSGARSLKYNDLLYCYAPDGLKLGNENFRHQADNKDEGPQVERLERLSFAEWSKKVRVASPSEKSVNELLEKRIRFGNYAHDLLSYIGTSDDVEAAERRFFAATPVADDERQELADYVRKVLSHPQTARFFVAGVEYLNECELVTEGQRLRPDRVVTADGKTWVVDYKTGAPLQEHKDQVARYCAALRRMGRENVQGCLVYLKDELNVVECV